MPFGFKKLRCGRDPAVEGKNPELGEKAVVELMKQVDERQANIEAAATAAVEAKKDAAATHEKTASLLAEARKEAAEIVSTAKLESAEMLSLSEKKAKKTAEQIVADAHVQIDADIARVKKELYNETLDLVSLATKKVIGNELNDKIDNKRIAAAVKDVE